MKKKIIKNNKIGGKNKMGQWILLMFYVICTVGGLILFKYGANQNFAVGFVNKSLNININIFSIIGLVLYLCSFILYMFVLSKYDITYIMPIISVFTTIGIYFLAIIVLNEAFSWYRFIGTIVILGGAMLVNMGK